MNVRDVKLGNEVHWTDFKIGDFFVEDTYPEVWKVLNYNDSGYLVAENTENGDSCEWFDTGGMSILTLIQVFPK